VTLPGIDLKPPLVIRDTMSTLKEIMQVYKQSLLDEEDRGLLDDFDLILEAVIDPVLQLVDEMKELKQVDLEKLIFECNCTVFVQNALDTFPSIRSSRTEALKERLQRIIENLTQIQYAHLLKESGLEPIVEVLNKLPEKVRLSHVPAASSRALASSIRSFDSFLSHIDTLTSSRLALLSSHRLSKEIHHAALQRIVEAYGRIWEAVMDEKNRYEFRSTVMHRSREEVKTLLVS